jgi:hypothetical protein
MSGKPAGKPIGKLTGKPTGKPTGKSTGKSKPKLHRTQTVQDPKEQESRDPRAVDTDPIDAELLEHASHGIRLRGAESQCCLHLRGLGIQPASHQHGGGAKGELKTSERSRMVILDQNIAWRQAALSVADPGAGLVADRRRGRRGLHLPN